MEKRVFCNFIVILAAIYGLTFSGCDQSSDSDYHSVTRNEETDETSPITDPDEKQSTPVEPDKSDNQKNQSEEPGSPESLTKKESDKDTRESETAVKDTAPQEDENALSEDSFVTAKKLKSRVDKNIQLVKEGKLEIRQVEWEEPVKAVKPEDLLPEDIVREVKILIPEKSFRKEGKEGILRVSYDDIDLLKVLNMEPVTADAPQKMPSWLKELDGKRIRIRGFMYPHELMEGIEVFALARDNQICCFGKLPKIYDVFNVFMREGKTTKYIQGRPFDVEGVFHIDVIEEDGEMLQLYYIDDALVLKK